MLYVRVMWCAYFPPFFPCCHYNKKQYITTDVSTVTLRLLYNDDLCARVFEYHLTLLPILLG